MNLYDLIKRLQDSGYILPPGLSSLLASAPRDIEGYVGEGRQLLAEMELDRKNIFRTLFKDRWMNHLEEAHTIFSENDFCESTIDVLLLNANELFARKDEVSNSGSST